LFGSVGEMRNGEIVQDALSGRQIEASADIECPSQSGRERLDVVRWHHNTSVVHNAATIPNIGHNATAAAGHRFSDHVGKPLGKRG
jgi:hypothetical protein